MPPLMQECERKGKWIRGCNFEARYDERGGQLATIDWPAIGVAAENVWDAQDMETILQAHRDSGSSIYICDVCTTCGKVIKRM